MKVKLLAGAALAAVFAASGACAQDSGWYGAADIGAHYMEPLNFVVSDPGLTPPVEHWTARVQEYDWTAFARLGYRVSPNVRVELEGGYRPGNLNSVVDRTDSLAICAPGSTTTCGRPNGSVDSWTVMGNVLFDLLPHSAFTPFIGGGIGANRVNGTLSGDELAGAVALTARGDPAFAGSIVKFAYQGIAGLSWRASEHVNVDLTYRYLSGSDLGDFKTNAVFNYGAYSDQSLTLGLRYAFFAPPPPPPTRPCPHW